MQKKLLTQSTKISRVVPRSYDFAIQKKIRKSTKCLAHRNSSEQVYWREQPTDRIPHHAEGSRSFFSTIVVFPQRRGNHKCGTKKHVRGSEKPEGRRNQSAEKTPLLNVPFWGRKIPTLSAKVFGLIHSLIGNSQKMPWVG